MMARLASRAFAVPTLRRRLGFSVAMGICETVKTHAGLAIFTVFQIPMRPIHRRSG